jgi:CheY-like chemotaxis protein
MVALLFLILLLSFPEPGDVVISDIMITEMDGFELLKPIRDDMHLKDIPVILCTAKQDTESIKKAIELACDDYIVKPINDFSLLQKVNKALGVKCNVL